MWEHSNDLVFNIGELACGFVLNRFAKFVDLITSSNLFSHVKFFSDTKKEFFPEGKVVGFDKDIINEYKILYLYIVWKKSVINAKIYIVYRNKVINSLY